MNSQLTVSEIFKNAAQLSAHDFEHLFRQMVTLRFKKNGKTVLSSAETELLQKINKGFPTEKWERLQYLDMKVEANTLSTDEENESLELAEAYEAYTVERTQHLSELALLRQISIDQLMQDLGIQTAHYEQN
jgi:hypothetical protein